jgi:hypothetical protein
MTALQSSDTEAITVDIRQDATHPKEVPMHSMGTRVKIGKFHRRDQLDKSTRLE